MSDPVVLVGESVGADDQILSRCLFGIKGPKGQTTVFFEALERAALMVKALLEEE